MMQMPSVRLLDDTWMPYVWEQHSVSVGMMFDKSGYVNIPENTRISSLKRALYPYKTVGRCERVPTFGDSDNQRLSYWQEEGAYELGFNRTNLGLKHPRTP